MDIQEHRFAVSDVKVGDLRPEQHDVTSVVQSLIGTTQSVIDAGCQFETVIPPSAHGFIEAACIAFDNHLPLTIGPDDIWLAILQGYANHPTPDGGSKLHLVVQRDDFLSLNPRPWHDVFAAFSTQIGDHIGADLHCLLTEPFSTTGEVELASFNVATMGAMKNRFSYEFITRCGIPEIRLLGTSHDWSQLLSRAERLLKPELTWWWRELQTALNHFVAASEGQPDRHAWRSFFKWDEQSGGPYVDGWINAFIPYLFKGSQTVKNPNLLPRQGGPGLHHSPTTLEMLPSSLTAVPLIWSLLDARLDIQFIAGFVGIAQDTDQSVRPAIGWAVSKSTKTQ
jgi:hypothetical protein